MGTIDTISNLMLTVPTSKYVIITEGSGEPQRIQLSDDEIDNYLIERLQPMEDNESYILEELENGHGDIVALRVIDDRTDVVVWKFEIIDGKLNAD